MDSEVRHELEKNSLAEILSKGGSKAKPYLAYVLIVCVLCAIALIAFVMIGAANQERLQQGWNALSLTTTPDGLEQVAADYEGTLVAGYAELQLGWRWYDEGKDLLTVDRGESIRKFDDAAEAFQKAIDVAQPGDAIVAQARLGMGLSHEAQSKLEEAKQNYQAVVDSFGNEPLAQLASYRLSVLQTPEAEEFYQSLKNYLPPEPSSDLPTKIDASPGAGIDSSTVIPDVPEEMLNTTLPNIPAPPTGLPAKPAETPIEETPAPSAGTPEAESKPAEEPTPAEEKKPEAPPAATGEAPSAPAEPAPEQPNP